MAKHNLSPYLMWRDRSTGESTPHAPDPLANDDDSQPNWQIYADVMRKHIGIIIAFFLSVVLTAGYLMMRQVPIYAAAATLLIERQAPQLADIQQMLSEPFDADQHNYYKTQYEILKSKSLAAQVIQDHHLEPIFTAAPPNRKTVSASGSSGPNHGSEPNCMGPGHLRRPPNRVGLTRMESRPDGLTPTVAC